MIPRKLRPKPDERTQPTQPKGIDSKTGKPYEPIEIPVPSREAVLKNIAKAGGRAERRHGQD